MKKTEVKMNKPIYLGMSILDISKALMYKFWRDYAKPKYGDRAKLCYTDTDIANDVEDGSIHLTMMRMMKECFQ